MHAACASHVVSIDERTLTQCCLTCETQFTIIYTEHLRAVLRYVSQMAFARLAFTGRTSSSRHSRTAPTIYNFLNGLQIILIQEDSMYFQNGRAANYLCTGITPETDQTEKWN